MKESVVVALVAVVLLVGQVVADRDQLTHHERGKHKHGLLLFMGGLKSLGALVLIKIKIALAVVAVAALVAFTVRYLYGGLPELFYNKVNPVPPQPFYPTYLMPAHDDFYGYSGYPTSIPSDHSNHESYGSNWSKLGDGGRSSFSSSYARLGEVLLQNLFYPRRKMKKKDLLNFHDTH